jgi:hypothetical protein
MLSIILKRRLGVNNFSHDWGEGRKDRLGKKPHLIARFCFSCFLISQDQPPRLKEAPLSLCAEITHREVAG